MKRWNWRAFDWKQELRLDAWMVAGLLLMTVAYNYFFVPNQIAPGGQLPHHVGPVDVVEAAGVALQPAVQEGLEGAHRKLVGRLGHGDCPGAPLPHIAQDVALPRAGVSAGEGGG